MTLRYRLLGAVCVAVAGLAYPVAAQEAQDARPISDLVADLRSDDVELRRRAVYALWQRREDGSAAAPAVAVAIRDEDEYVRTTAARVLPWVAAGSAESVGDLEIALRDDRADVRVAAAQGIALVGRGSRTALASILRALEDTDPRVQQYAASALVWLGPDDATDVLPSLEQAYESESDSVRAWVMNAAMNLCVPATLPLAERGLDDTSALVRERALAIVGGLGPEPQLPLVRLLPMVADEAWSVRRAALMVLGIYREDSERLVPLLIWAGGDEHSWVRAQVFETLTRLELVDARTRDLIAAGVRDDELITRMTALRAARALGDDAAPLIPALRARLAETDEDAERSEVARCLGALGPVARAAAPDLRALVREPGDLSISAAYALCAMSEPDERPLDVMIDALDDDLLWFSAAHTLGQLGERALPAREPLEARIDVEGQRGVAAAAALLHIVGPDHRRARTRIESALRNTDDDRQQRTAVRLLGELPRCAPWSVPELTEALWTREIRVRQLAATALGALGPAARTALPALRELSHEDDYTLRANALNAIRRIGYGE